MIPALLMPALILGTLYGTDAYYRTTHIEKFKEYTPFTRKVGTGFRISEWIKKGNILTKFGFPGLVSILSS